MSKSDAKQNARQAAEFLTTDFGQRFIKGLSDEYNRLHHEAERDTLTVEQKAFKVERAAGVKWAIDYLIERDRLLREGYFDKEQV